VDKMIVDACQARSLPYGEDPHSTPICMSPERNRMRGFAPLPLQYRRLLARAAAARRVRRGATLAARLASEKQVSIEADALGFFANLPLRARLANRFADVVLAIDDALTMCEVERNESRDASWIEPSIRRTYEQVNALMEAVSD
jgi:hypothetical protein